MVCAYVVYRFVVDRYESIEMQKKIATERTGKRQCIKENTTRASEAKQASKQTSEEKKTCTIIELSLMGQGYVRSVALFRSVLNNNFVFLSFDFVIFPVLRENVNRLRLN